MMIYSLDPVSAAADGPFAELRAWSGDDARRKAHLAFPNDGWLDEARFEGGPLGVARDIGPNAVNRYSTRSALPPVR